jgi:hypothetical protein
MAAETGRRVDTSIDAVAGDIIPAVGHAPPAVGAVFEGWFQPRAQAVAVAAETLLVAHGAYRRMAAGRTGMPLGEEKIVAEALEGEVALCAVVAVQALTQVFTRLWFHVLQGQLKGPSQGLPGGENAQGGKADEAQQQDVVTGSGLEASL